MRVRMGSWHEMRQTLPFTGLLRSEETARPLGPYSRNDMADLRGALFLMSEVPL